MFRLVVLSALLATCLGGYLPFPDGKVVGGHDVSIESFPYQISLQRNGRHSCGGSIINERVILTAAHCIHGLTDPRILSVKAGITELNSRGGQVRRVERIIEHERYRTLNNDFDVALLVLEDKLHYDRDVKPVVLDTRRTEHGEEVIVTGWGTTSEGGSIPNHLQGVEMEVVSNERCKDTYGIRLTSRMMCAAVDKGGKDACQGDSGGPLVNDRKEQVGVVSWGFGCAREGVPGVYATVALLHDWIDEHARHYA